jgi:transposase
MSKNVSVGMVWVGIDVSKESFHASVADEASAPREWAVLPVAPFAMSAPGMREFLAWVRGFGVAKDRVAGICIEATGRYSGQWMELLHDRLGAVSQVNPAQPKAFAYSLGIRDKSDPVDARVLALYGKVNEPRPMSPASPIQRELRELARLRHSLESQCHANQQRLADGPSSLIVCASLKKANKALAREIERVGKAMDALIRKDDTLKKDFKRAKTVKGIGAKTAMTILAEFGDLRQYNRDELVALCGLYPREYTSGKSVRKKPRLVKGGKANVRAALYMCAMSAIRADAHLGAFAKRLTDNGKEPMQVIGAVMRKLLMLVRAVVVSETDYDPNYQQRVQSQAA